MFTIDELLQTGASAVGLRSAELDAEDLARLERAFKTAVRGVAAARPWPFLLTAWNAALTAGDLLVYLPADFARFDRGTGLHYAAASALRALGTTTYGNVVERRAQGAVSGPPLLYALGPTPTSGDHAGQRELHVWPTPDAAYTLTSVYHRWPTIPAVPSEDGDELPDLPPECGPALRAALRHYATEEFKQEANDALRAAMYQEIETAWAAVAVADPAVRVLRDVTPCALSGYPRGREGRLDADAFGLD